jgi:hypothetical protein
MKPWLAKTSDGRFAIEKIPCPHPNVGVVMGKPAAGVMHTTEGSWAGAMSVFRNHYAPHFLVGTRRIAQLVPLGDIAAALENPPGGVETNTWARVQIEVVGHSKETPYSFPATVTDPLASLLATLKVEAGIPLTRPYPDAMPPKPWATPTFRRRHDGKWGHTAGWFGHVEVPENSHWDPGALMWEPLLLKATQRLPKPKPPPKKIGGYWLITHSFYDGHSVTTKTGALRLWVLRQGNLQKKGVRDVRAHWVETA